jgi:hypothetical protein
MFFDLPNLETIVLVSNKIENLEDDSFKSIRKTLRSLNLSINKLDKQLILDFSYLETSFFSLGLSFNELTSDIIIYFQAVSSTLSLGLSNNNLIHFEYTDTELSKFLSLSLESNRLQSFKISSPMPSLVYIWKITSWAAWIEKRSAICHHCTDLNWVIIKYPKLKTVFLLGSNICKI